MRIDTIDLHDLGIPGSIAAYVVTGSAGPVLIEVGPSATFERLRKGLGELGMKLTDIRHAVVSHIHFDHAGAAGHLAQSGAMIHVHEFGVRHLLDPSRLVASAQRIYGDAMNQRWGPILPVPGHQLRSVSDGDVLVVGDIELRAMETPGHARHHHAWTLETDSGPVCFAGDAVATHVSGTEFISLPTPPPEFDLELWLATIDRIFECGFTRLYPTHFGVVVDVDMHLQRVRHELINHTAFVRSMFDEGLDNDAIAAIYRRFVDEQADRLGMPDERRRFYVSESVARMNVMGMLRYLRQRVSVPA